MFGDTPLHMIEDDAALASLIEKLRGAPVIGVDTEADSFHHYQEKLCLVQISDLEADYIVDPLKVSDVTPLKQVLEDPETVIVLHGGDYDVVSLKRDFDIHINNIFDTMIAGQFLALPRIGLGDLIGRFFGHTIDKKYQRHDWALRPLEPEHLDYARGDTHWLLALREVMSLHLERAGRLDAHREECEHLALREWSGRGSSDADFLRVKGSSALDPEGLRVLRAVWTYRDDQARRMDRPAFKVLPGQVLLDLAKKQPVTESALHRIMRPGSSMTRKHGASLLEAVQAGLEDERPLPERPKGGRNGKKRLRRSSADAPGVDKLYGVLKDWRNRIVDEQGLPPVVVANNTLLKDIARVAPGDAEQLSGVPGMRRWQVKEFGDHILSLIAGVSSDEPPKPKRKRRRRRRRKSGDAAGTPSA